MLMLEGKGSALVLIIVLLISDVMHDHSMFEGLTFRGEASDGDATPRVRGSNTP